MISSIVTIEDINQAISKCEYEQQHNIKDGLFKTEYPDKSVFEQQAQEEAEKTYKFDIIDAEIEEAKKSVATIATSFSEEEPTPQSLTSELEEQARQNVKAFLPWKQKRLRHEYVEARLDGLFSERHSAWQRKADEYKVRLNNANALLEEKRKEHDDKMHEKRDFVRRRSFEMFNAAVEKWEQERNEFLNIYHQTMQNVIDGDKDYINKAIDSALVNDVDELPMEYFVDYAYDETNGRVLVDLDFPEIEDVPVKKINLTSSGKRSIRTKSQINMREDYAKCICGLSMYVASLIFNVSLKIKEVEICGFTQRKSNNSALTSDQYILLVNFSRDLFQRIVFTNFSSIEILNFFKHNIEMSKSFVFKELDLGSAYEKMETYATADYDEYVKNHPLNNKVNIESPKTISNDEDLSSQWQPTSTTYETFLMSETFSDNMRTYIKDLTTNDAINKHLEGLNGIIIHDTNGELMKLGTCDTSTFAGRIIFCVFIDLYRIIRMLDIDTSKLSQSLYPFALYINKCFVDNAKIGYSTIHLMEPVVATFTTMVDPMLNRIPTPDKYFLIYYMTYDYEDLSWNKRYVSLLQEYVKIVAASIRNDISKKRCLKNLMEKLKELDITGNSAYIDRQNLDPLLEQAACAIVEAGVGSTSLIQRKFSIGYNRAGRIMDQLERLGIIGHPEGAKPRDVLIKDLQKVHDLINN